MSKTVVQIVQADNYRAAQPPQVMVAAGNSIEFVNSGSGITLLVLTPETAGILSPTPTSPVTIAGNESITYTFLVPTGSGYLARVLPGGTTPWPFDPTDAAPGPILTILSSDDRNPTSHTGT